MQFITFEHMVVYGRMDVCELAYQVYRRRDT